jgi:excisionase family DNA binding protein
MEKACDTKLFENLLTKEDVAREFNLSPRTIANWISLGRLAAVRIGRRNMLLRAAVEEWIEKQKFQRNRRRKKKNVSISA